MFNNPFRKPTFTSQPQVDLFGRLNSTNNGVYPGDPGFEDPPTPWRDGFRRFYNRHKGVFGSYFLLIATALLFLGWCWMLASNPEVVQSTGWNDCPAGSQRIHGWSNGRYTNLCIDPVRR